MPVSGAFEVATGSMRITVAASGVGSHAVQRTTIEANETAGCTFFMGTSLGITAFWP